MTNHIPREPEFDSLVSLKMLINLLKRNIWLLLLGVLLGSGIFYLFSRFQIPVYQARTQVLVSRSSNSASVADVSQALSIQQLTQTYVELLSQEWVSSDVAARIGGSVNKSQITLSVANNTQIINIVTEAPDAHRAALIADTLVQVLIGQNEATQASRYNDAEEGLNLQIQQVQQQISDVQTRLDEARVTAFESKIASTQEKISETQALIDSIQSDIDQLSQVTGPDSLDKTLQEKSDALNTQKLLLASYQNSYTTLMVSGESQVEDNEITRLDKDLSLYQQIYINLVNSRESIRLEKLQNMPNVIQNHAAVAGNRPIRPRIPLNTLLGGISGLIVAIAGVLLVDFLDSTLKTREDVEKLLDLPVLGYVLQLNSESKAKPGPYVVHAPRSPVAEGFRSLRTNLEFIGIDKPVRSILVSSPGNAEGKTTLAVNLAATIAQSGKRVVLLDADLRRPRIHREMGLVNRIGLSDVFREKVSLEEVFQTWEGLDLTVISSGGIPPNPAELLGSKRMRQIVDELETKFDIVIIDSAPTIVTDSQLISALVDGVLLVLWPGKTHIETARSSVEQYRRVGANLLGVVMNNIRPGLAYGGYTPYYSNKDYYHYSENENHGNRMDKLRFRRRKIGENTGQEHDQTKDSDLSR